MKVLTIACLLILVNSAVAQDFKLSRRAFLIGSSVKLVSTVVKRAPLNLSMTSRVAGMDALMEEMIDVSTRLQAQNPTEIEWGEPGWRAHFTSDKFRYGFQSAFSVEKSILLETPFPQNIWVKSDFLGIDSRRLGSGLVRTLASKNYDRTVEILRLQSNLNVEQALSLIEHNAPSADCTVHLESPPQCLVIYREDE